MATRIARSELALEAPDDLGGLVVRTVAGLGRRPGERAELPVAGVAQARDDVPALVEVRVERRHVDVDVGMGRRRAWRPPPARR